jgi:hypothetical protein
MNDAQEETDQILLPSNNQGRLSHSSRYGMFGERESFHCALEG